MSDEQLLQIRLPSAARGPWRSVEEHDGTAIIDPAELPSGAGSADGWSRRGFLKLLGASAALAAGCDRSLPEEILPYSVRPKEVVPGVPQYYATHWLHEGFAVGLLVESNEGRPTKIEGNPDHPASLGGTGRYEQALALGVYDPDRAGNVRNREEPSSWDALFERLRKPRSDRGAGLRLLLEPTSSPTIARLLDRVRALHPASRVTFHAPIAAVANTMEGARLAFGRPLQPVYDLTAADVILSLDADLLGQMPFGLRYARHWAERRRSADPNRLYTVECTPTVTGLAGEHRLRRRSAEVVGTAAAIALGLPDFPAALRPAARAVDPGGQPFDTRFIGAVARDLSRRPPGRTLVVVGERQPAALHALGFAMNSALGNLGKTVRLIAPVLLASQDQDLGALVGELRSGKVDTLLMLDGNPVYTAPVDLELAAALQHVAERIYVGGYENETAAQATWFAPLAHSLEAWGDGRAYDGTLCLQQPLVRPLRGGKSVPEILAALAGDRAPSGHRLMMETHGDLDVDAALRRGVVPGSAAQPMPAQLADTSGIADALGRLRAPRKGALEIDFQPSPTLYDGRFSNNAWLLEQPEPVTKLTWDNAVLMSPATATRLGLRTQDLVELARDGRTLRGPVLVTPGHADEAITVWLGYGRSGAESLARGVGFDAYRLRDSASLAFADEVTLRRTAGTHELARTQLHFSMHGRDIALSTTRAELARHPVTPDDQGPQPSLLPAYSYTGLQWAMSIDLTICTGCSTCMLACQSENNLPVVGKGNVLLGREMEWLRIDSYFRGTVEDPVVVHQPMMCQHCETAPCEYVCPVNATVHSSDGLNEMIYNRCVGTKFCSNNCPYKVRRFNWFNWKKRYPELNAGSYELQHNPDVTVRDRGVMEKCTYCVQRIRGVEIRARIEGRDIRPGEVVTACQQACPTGAIQFGSLSHEDTPMTRWRQEARAYSVLNDQGTRPRTRYLMRVDNPNRELL